MEIEKNSYGDSNKSSKINDSLRSDNFNEILSIDRGHTNKFVIFIYIGVVLSIIISAWYIQYPEIIKTRATLIASNAPKEIISNHEGRIIKLFARDGQTVKSGDILAFLESSAKHEQIIRLNGLLDSTIFDLQKNNTQFIFGRLTRNFDQLGELQQAYQQFIYSFQQFDDYWLNGFYLKKKSTLTEDFIFLLKNYEILKQEKILILKDLNLSEESYKANEQLYNDRVISKLDVRNEESKLLNKQLSLAQINSSLVSNKLLQKEKQKEINELEHSISIQKTIFLQATQTMKSIIEDWEKKYIIKSPITGKLTLLIPLQENTYIKFGKILGLVSPIKNNYYAEITIPQYNFGKADINQIVQFRFDAYPYQEYGFVEGRIIYISDIPTDSGFVAHVQVPSTIITNQNKKLKYREGLKAEALIITKQNKLVDRFLNNINFNLKP